LEDIVTLCIRLTTTSLNGTNAEILDLTESD
jgi:hypothetical protein